MTPEMIGDKLSQYRIVDKLGAGGMGEVYLAEDQNLKRKVALKVMPPDMAENPERLDRFKREAEAVAALNHPNIVTIYNIEEIEGRRVLIMELVEGRSLDRVLSPEGLPLPEVLTIALQLTGALAAAHEKGIVHRDLKPANIMIRPDGQVKVLDFGLAKFIGFTAGSFGEDDETQAVTKTAELTREGTVVGTAPYMSPEQLKGEAVDHRTDIFSLGTVLHEMATGSRPFAGDSGIEVASRILRDVPPSVCEVRKGLPQSLGTVIQTCLEKDPEDRYPSVAQVRDELESLSKEVEAGTARYPDPALPVNSKPVDSEAVPIDSGEVVVGSLLPSTPEAARRRRPWIGVAVAVVVLLAVAVWWRQRDARPSAPATPTLDSEAEQKIAVLPFATRGTEQETGSFADGVHDDLLTTLTGIGGLKVISRTSVLQYRDTTKNLRQIGRELGAANLLEGSVQQIGDQVRINVQLINAATDEHLWAQTYDRELSVANLFEIQSEIAQTVAEALSVTLSTEERERLREDPTDDLEAFYAYNRGKQLFARSTFDSLRAAQLEFERALEIDPRYVLASIALARTHAMLAQTGATTVEDMLRDGRPAIDRAIALDPDDPYALAVLGRYQMVAGEPGFEETFDRALELGPNIVDVLDIYAGFLRGRQRYSEALDVIERALDLDPLSTSLFHDLGRTHIALGNFDLAMRAFERISQIDPENPWAAHGSGLAAVLAGRLPEAAYWTDKASEFDPADFENQATATFVYMSYGDVEMAAKRAGEALALGPGEPYPLAAKAYMLTMTGDREGAVRVARTALAKQLDDRWRSQLVFLRVMRDEAIETGEPEEALAWYRQLTPELFTDPPQVDSGNVQKAVDLAHLLRLTGDSARAERILERAIAAYDQRYAKGAANFPLGVAKAEALALLSRPDEAIDSLRRVVDDGWRLLWRWDTQFNRNFDDLREDPRFIAIQNEIEADLAAQVVSFESKPLT